MTTMTNRMMMMLMLLMMMMGKCFPNWHKLGAETGTGVNNSFGKLCKECRSFDGIILILIQYLYSTSTRNAQASVELYLYLQL